MTILLTRPAENSLHMAAELDAMGLPVLVAPMLTIETMRVEWPQPSDYDGIIVTSANAFRNLPCNWGAACHSLYAVGERTAVAARKCGFRNVRVAAGTSLDLEVMLAAEELRGKRFLYPSGAHLSRDLKVSGIEIVPFPVYTARATEELDPHLLDMIDRGGVAAAVFYSVRTASVFSGLVEKYGRTDCFRKIKALCLSAPVVKSVGRLPWSDVRQAERPDHSSMLALLRDFCP